MNGVRSDEKTLCYHCGDDCRNDVIQDSGKVFCCLGCKTVHNILQQNDLSQFYQIEKHAGPSQRERAGDRYEFLEDEKLIEDLILFRDEQQAGIIFFLPQIHCSACIWLLERLYKFNDAIADSKVNFLKKEVSITFNPNRLNVRQLAELLQSIGYPPTISLDQSEKKRSKKRRNRKLSYQIGLAGFAFGNIMLLSLPEYLGIDRDTHTDLGQLFNWLNLLLATPVAIYSGQDYFKSAWTSLKQQRLNIDVPIALGVLVLYLRSTFEIVNQSGAGYFDSLCGLLFFLLLGRLFQQKVYHQLSFERDYRSYFPIAVTKLEGNQKKSIPLQNLEKGDHILVRNGELIPVDALLISDKTSIDNSFISGESRPIQKACGDKIFAGGRQIGSTARLEVLKPLDQSRLTSLWNRYANMNKEKSHSYFSATTDKISQWFTPILLGLAIAAGFLHLDAGWSKTIEVVTAVLIVACPCALALSAPFSLGYAIRKAGRRGVYFRDAAVMENLAKIKHIVFDKTGTLTLKKDAQIKYNGNRLNDYEAKVFASLLSQSTHPLSKLLYEELKSEEEIEIDHYEEIEGKGILGVIDGKVYQVGSPNWLNLKITGLSATTVVFAFEKEIIGYYSIRNAFRESLGDTLQALSKNYQLSMLSGDNNLDREKIEGIFPQGSYIHFEQSPEDKVGYIENRKEEGDSVAMVGDGLNDSAAIQTADVGISVAEDVHAFAPASDVIIEGKSFSILSEIFNYSKYCKKVIYISFGISFLYNIIGLSFAFQGLLSPVIAAILMPISSITVVGFASLANWVKPLRA